MGRFTRLACALTVAVAGLSVAASPAQAHVELTDPIVLPQSGHGDVVRLPGQRVLAVAGGDESPVVLVDLDTRATTVVAGTTGVRTLDLDDDATHLHGVSRTPDEVVEISVADRSVTRRWDVADACSLGDVVMRGGWLWVAQQCGFSEVRRLDPTTGDLVVPDPDLDAGSLVGDPGSARFYAFDPGTASVLSHREVRPSGLPDELARSEDGYGVMQTGDIHLSADGGTLWAPNRGGFGGADDSWTWKAGSLDYTGEWPRSLDPTWSDADHVGGWLDSLGAPALVGRAGFRVVNSFLPDDAVDMSADDVRLVDDEAVVIGTVEGQKRLYVLPMPLDPQPTVDIEVPWRSTGVDTPTPVTGRVLDGSVPRAGQSLQLVQLEPTRRVLGEVITGADGTWSTTWTPSAIGGHVLEVRLDAGRDSVDRVRVPVTEVYERLDVVGPGTVEGGQEVVMTATVTRNGHPVEGHSVHMTRRDWAKPFWDVESLGSATTDAEGEATFRNAAGAVDGYWYEASADLPHGNGRPDAVRVVVDRSPTTLSVEPARTAAVPGDPVPVTVQLTSQDGEPLAGEQVLLQLRPHTGDGYVAQRVTTGLDGTATYIDTSTQEAVYQIEAEFAGSVLQDDVRTRHDGITRRRVATTTTLDEVPPAGAEVGDTVTVSGDVTPVEGPVELTLVAGEGNTQRLTTDAAGRWATDVTVSDPGEQNWAAIFAGTTRLAPSRADFAVSAARLTTGIEVSEVSVTADRGLEVRGTVHGLTTRSAVSFQVDDQPVDLLWTDGDFWYYRPPWQLDEGASRLVIRYDGDHRHEPARQDVDFTVGPRPSTLALGEPQYVDPGETFEVDGSVRPAVSGEVVLSVSDPAGTTRDVPVDLVDGDFQLPLTVPAAQADDPTWTVTYPGSGDLGPATRDYTAQLRTPRPMELVNDLVYRSIGDRVRLSVRASGDLPATVRVVVRNRRGEVLLDRVRPFDPAIPVLDRQPSTAWEVTAVLPATEQHLRTRRTLRITPIPHLAAGMHEGDTPWRARPYTVYDRGADAELRLRVSPQDLDGCVTTVVQRFRAGTWRPVRRSCDDYPVTGGNMVVFDRPWPAGARLRTISRFGGSEWYQPSTSVWRYFRIRKR